MSSWELKHAPFEMVSPEIMYDIASRHKLEHADVQTMVAKCLAMQYAELYFLVSGEARVASIVLSIAGDDRGVADLDFIPQSKFFRGDHYKKDLISAMQPLWQELFVDNNVRRVSAFVPAPRKRALRALKVCGFRHEGFMEEGVCLRDVGPVGLYILGLLPGRYKMIESESEEYHGVSRRLG